MEKIIYGFYNSQFGEMILAKTDEGLCWLGFMVEGMKGNGARRMQKYFSNADFIKGDINILGDDIMKAWDGGEEMNISLDIRGTDFQKSVWNALLDVGKGDVKSYGNIANAIGKPKAARAVGTSVGQNPISLIIPCHRIIKKSGELGNYGWGVDLKKRILSAEGLKI